MGTTTSTTVVNNITIIVYNVPSDILGLAVTNLDIPNLYPAPKGDEAAGIDQQAINNNVPQQTKEVFAQEFGYQMPPTNPPSLPKNIHPPSDGSNPDFTGYSSESFWYKNNDPLSDKQVIELARTATLNAFAEVDGIKFYTYDESSAFADVIATDIKGVFNVAYSVWTPITRTYTGDKVINTSSGNVRARIDLAIKAFHGQTVDQSDGVYLDVKYACYVAKYNPL